MQITIMTKSCYEKKSTDDFSFFHVAFCLFIYPIFCSFILFQLIHTISVVDRDEPQSGHRFHFTLAPEASSNQHFTLLDIKGENYDRLLSLKQRNVAKYELFSIFCWTLWKGDYYACSPCIH